MKEKIIDYVFIDGKVDRIKTAQKKWRNKNGVKEKLCNQTIMWQKAHPEKVKEYQRNYVKAHPKRVLESAKRWKTNNPEYVRNWQKANPEKVKEYQRRWQKAHPKYAKEYALRRSAANDGLRPVPVQDGNEPTSNREKRGGWRTSKFVGGDKMTKGWGL